MVKRIFIRCSIPISSRQDELVQKLKQWGFHIDEIKPSTPKKNELTAYEVHGVFDRTWDDFFDVCKKIHLEFEIKKILSELVVKGDGAK